MLRSSGTASSGSVTSSFGTGTCSTTERRHEIHLCKREEHPFPLESEGLPFQIDFVVEFGAGNEARTVTPPTISEQTKKITTPVHNTDHFNAVIDRAVKKQIIVADPIAQSWTNIVTHRSHPWISNQVIRRTLQTIQDTVSSAWILGCDE